MPNETYILITPAMCAELTQKIKALKTQNKYFRRMLTHYQVEQHTGINMNSLGHYIGYDKLPVSLYYRLKAYVEEVIKANEIVKSEELIEHVDKGE